MPHINNNEGDWVGVVPLDDTNRAREIEKNARWKAQGLLEKGTIGNLRRTDKDLIGLKVISIDRSVPKKLGLTIKSIDWEKGIAMVDGESFGMHEIPIDKLRRIDAITKAVDDVVKS